MNGTLLRSTTTRAPGAPQLSISADRSAAAEYASSSPSPVTTATPSITAVVTYAFIVMQSDGRLSRPSEMTSPIELPPIELSLIV